MMSGTSLDGLDLALCHFNKEGKQWHYTVEKAVTISYPSVLRSRLSKATELSGWELARLDVDLGNFMADAVNLFLKKTPCKVLLLASHGHTVFHRPDLGITTQIGNGAALAAKTGIRTVCDLDLWMLHSEDKVLRWCLSEINYYLGNTTFVSILVAFAISHTTKTDKEGLLILLRAIWR